MDNGEVELSDPIFLPNYTSSNTCIQGSTSLDSYDDDSLKHNRIYTHTHTDTRVLSSGEDNQIYNNISSLKPRKSLGNREAVRKYREKKKAHVVYLEEEVKKLHLLNQHLVRKLQKQLSLEAEMLRLRTVLLELKGKIDGVFGSFQYQKHGGLNFNEDDYEMVHSSRTVGAAIGLQCPSVVIGNDEVDAERVISRQEIGNRQWWNVV